MAKLSMRLDETSLGKIMDFIHQQVQSEPVISVCKGRVQIKDITVSKQKNHYAVHRRGQLLETFSYRSWAIAYATSLATNNGLESYLARSEHKLSQLLIDKHIYDHHMLAAERRRDTVRAKIISDRMSRTDIEIIDILDTTQQVVLYQRFA